MTYFACSFQILFKAKLLREPPDQLPYTIHILTKNAILHYVVKEIVWKPTSLNRNEIDLLWYVHLSDCMNENSRWPIWLKLMFWPCRSGWRYGISLFLFLRCVVLSSALFFFIGHSPKSICIVYILLLYKHTYNRRTCAGKIHTSTQQHRK